VEREIARILAELSGHVARREGSFGFALSPPPSAAVDCIQAVPLADELSAAEPTVTPPGRRALLAGAPPAAGLSDDRSCPTTCAPAARTVA